MKFLQFFIHLIDVDSIDFCVWLCCHNFPMFFILCWFSHHEKCKHYFLRHAFFHFFLYACKFSNVPDAKQTWTESSKKISSKLGQVELNLNFFSTLSLPRLVFVFISTVQLGLNESNRKHKIFFCLYQNIIQAKCCYFVSLFFAFFVG